MFTESIEFLELQDLKESLQGLDPSNTLILCDTNTARHCLPLLELEDFISCFTTKPKKIFGIRNHSIQEGNIADISIFNPEVETIFTKADILSNSKNSAFINKKLKGKVYGIFSNNQLIIN